MTFLDDAEKAETVDGYIGEPRKTKTPNMKLHTAKDKEMQQHIWNRHETMNVQFKESQCLDKI